MDTKEELLEFYNRCMVASYMPDRGLCNCLAGKAKKKLLKFKPTDEKLEEMYKEGLSTVYWGCGQKEDRIREQALLFTKRRQEIVLSIIDMLPSGTENT